MMWWSLLLYPSVSILSPFDRIAPLQPSAETRVVVNEVYYDHPGRDDGWEFVELYNAGADTVSLAGWSIESLDGATGRSARLWMGAAGMRIAPGAVKCVAGAARDPSPGYLLAGELENGPDAVRLRSPAGVADVVGYGALALAGLFEGEPAPDVPAGTSLARKPDGADSDVNATDFVPARPTPGRRNFHARDISISLAPPIELPCRGAPFVLVARLENAGLEPFEGSVSVRALLRSGGAPHDSTALRKALRLVPGALDSIAFRAKAPLAERFAAEVFLVQAPDEWAGNDTARADLRSSPGAAVVNEIMYRPDKGESEWIEILCVAEEGCDLAGWTLSDATGSRRLISRDALHVPPCGYLILARDSASFAARYPRCTAPVRRPAGGWPALNDGEKDGIADRVCLRDAEGRLVESVAYRDLIGNERGRSIERFSETACSSTPGGLWHRSAARERATPGSENSTRAGKAPRGPGVTVAPNPFAPARGEAAITGTVGEGEDGFRVRIFSVAGIELRRIYGEKRGARTFSCRWDGRDGDGKVVPCGIYLCLVEYIGAGGGVCRKEKVCIVVAGS